jgi:hypothetical protein
VRRLGVDDHPQRVGRRRGDSHKAEPKPKPKTKNDKNGKKRPPPPRPDRDAGDTKAANLLRERRLT